MNERVPLSFLLTQNKDEQPPVEPIVPFAAFNGEDPVIVTAVLERTVTFHSIGDRHDTGLRRPDLIYVDPAALEWRTKTAGYEGERLSPSDHRKPGQRFRRYSDQSRTEQRAKTDEEALKNQAVVKKQKEDELRFLRQRARPAEGHEKKEEQMVSAVNTNAPFGAPVLGQGERLKHCRRCGEEKPASAFPATGIYGGYCSTCEPLEKAERAAARASGEKPGHKIGAKVTRRGRPRKAIEPTPPAVLEAGEVNGYANVIKLLQKRDGLRAELAKVNEQLQEALA